jgi:hypothetical protein
MLRGQTHLETYNTRLHNRSPFVCNSLGKTQIKEPGFTVLDEGAENDKTRVRTYIVGFMTKVYDQE